MAAFAWAFADTAMQAGRECPRGGISPGPYMLTLWACIELAVEGFGITSGML